MRRIKAIYLIPVFLVLLIGAAAASYYFLFKPQMEKVVTARSTWEGVVSACKTEENGYEQALQDRTKYATQLIKGHYDFKAIQQTMPQIYNMKAMPMENDRKRLILWYRIMGTGQLIKEMNRWTRSFHLPNAPTISYTGTMGYEETIPSATLVSVNFGEQKFVVRGFGNLTNAIRRTVGYGYYPLIINVGDKVSIAVDRGNPKHDPKRPILSMGYQATGYFFTRGWDPMDPNADADIKALIPTAMTAKPPVNHRTEWDPTLGPCPPVLFIIEQPGLVP